MRKLLPIMVVVIFIISGFGALAINVEKNDDVFLESLSETIEVDIASLKFIESENNYFEVSLGNEEFYLMNSELWLSSFFNVFNP